VESGYFKNQRDQQNVTSNKMHCF